ncbi:MAG: DMT family transporter [Xanthomonadales bacterium]|jgi:drug/metabolite transporter (DMT)-like permease
MSASGSHLLRTVILTITAMIAFAANSLLCRMALGQGLVDAASFTSIRIISGALVLLLIVSIRGHAKKITTDWTGVAALFGYMVFFSFAYRSLSAGTGALLLFGAVQLTMFVAALRHGERFTVLSWIGLGAAFAGLVYLVAPGVTAPDPVGALLMAGAGVAWGAYSLIGRRSGQPLLTTAANFLFAVPFTVGLSAVFIAGANVSLPGALLAVASGALASGLGYAIWYAALAGLTAGRAATVQLSVPVIAALGGALLLSEQITARLVVASGLTIGGIWVVLAQRSRRVSGSTDVASKSKR